METGELKAVQSSQQIELDEERIAVSASASAAGVLDGALMPMDQLEVGDKGMAELEGNQSYSVQGTEVEVERRMDRDMPEAGAVVVVVVFDLEIGEVDSLIQTDKEKVGDVPDYASRVHGQHVS